MNNPCIICKKVKKRMSSIGPFGKCCVECGNRLYKKDMETLASYKKRKVPKS